MQGKKVAAQSEQAMNRDENLGGKSQLCFLSGERSIRGFHFVSSADVPTGTDCCEIAGNPCTCQDVVSIAPT